MANTAITWTVEADFDKDGDYETDLTAYVARPGGAINIRRGLTAEGVYQVSRLSLTLLNSDGTFTRGNTASALHGLLDPEVPIRVKATHLSVEYTRWTGYIKRYSYSWGAGRVAQCRIDCEDIAAYLPLFEPVNVVHGVRTSGAALAAIFAAMGFTTDDYSVADGVQSFNHWVRNADGMSAAMEVVRSEMGGALYVDGNGVLVSEDRRSRLGLNRWKQQVLRDSPSVLWMFDEATGATVYDWSGNGRDLTLYNSPTRGVAGPWAGDPATATDLDASPYGQIADEAALDPGDTFSLEAVVSTDTLLAERSIVDKGSNGYLLRVQAGVVQIAKAGVGTIASATVSLSESTWTHILVTKSGSAVHIYLDGTDVTGTVTNYTIVATSTDLRIGARTNGTGYFNGQLAAFALYATALTAAQVQARYLAYKYGAWGDGTGIFPDAVEMAVDDTDLVDTATVTAQIMVDSDPNQIILGFSRNTETYGGRSADSIAIAAGEQYGPFEMDYARPILSLSTPVAGEDYKFNSAIGGNGTDLTSDLDVTVTDLGAEFRATLKNTGASDGYVTRFQLQGLPLDALFDRPQFKTTKAISGNKAGAGVSVLLTYADDDSRPPKAQDYSVALARRYRWPYERLTLDFDASDDTKKAALLALELGDLVRYTDTALGVDQETNVVAGSNTDDWYYVESMAEALVPGEAKFSFPMQVTLVPSWLYRDLDRIAYDLFERDDASGDLGTALCGTAWANDTGFDIASNAARANTDTLSMATLDLGTLAFDHVVEVTLTDIGTGDEVGLVARYVDANNQYRVYLDKGSNEVILEKNIGGSMTELSSPAFTVGTSHELRLMVQGNRFRVWVDRELVIDTTDAALNTGTKVGLIARNASGTTTFDDFYAEGL